MKCFRKSCGKEFVGRTNQIFCNVRCKRNERISQVRVRFKRRAVELTGGKCCRCGYSKCVRALQFHHVNPEQKSFGLSSGNTMSWDRYWSEVQKCILLCANCHAEEEDFLLGIRLIGKTPRC